MSKQTPITLYISSETVFPLQKQRYTKSEALPLRQNLRILLLPLSEFVTITRDNLF